MNLRHLAVFHAVAQTGGINRASEQLFVSQPAVSRQVRSLEDALGVALLERHTRGVRLTEAGTILADYASRLFALETQAGAVLADLRSLRSGTLRLGGSMSLGNYFLPAVIAEFNRRHPEVTVSLEVGNTDVVLNAVRKNRVDLGFVEGAFDESQFDSNIFMNDELIVIAPPGHPTAGKGPVPFSSLCRNECVMREPGSGTRSTLDALLRHAGVEEHRYNLTLGSPEAVKRAVAAGAGLAVASNLTVVDELAAGTLVHIPLQGPSTQRALRRVTLPHKQLGPAAEPFLELVAAHARRYGAPRGTGRQPSSSAEAADPAE